jgi:acetyl-CoA carboxylase biotin carboxyl carrier protein
VLAALQGTSISELEVEWGEGQLRLQREIRSDRVAPAPSDSAFDDGLVTVTSENVGVFHRDPTRALPDVGSVVAAGVLLGEIETLGVRNAVTAPAGGTIVEIRVQDGAPVEYGQPLAVIRPAAGLPGATES